MLLVFRVPIADIRSFFNKSKETQLPLPPRDDPPRDDYFIRGFGDLGDRFLSPAQKLWGNDDEYVYYSAKHGLRFAYSDKNGENSKLFRAEGIYGFRVAFRHFCFVKNDSQKVTSNSIGHFEVGFLLKFPNNRIDMQRIYKACTLIAELKTTQVKINKPIDSPATKEVIPKTLINSSKNIANYFCASTTRMRENSGGSVETQKKLNSYPYVKYVGAGTPIFIAALEYNEHLQLPDGGWRSGYPSKYTWSYGSVPIKDNKPVKLFVLEKGNKAGFDRYRKLLTSLSIIHDEYQGMALMNSLIENNGILSKPYSIELADLQELRHVMKKKIAHALKDIDKYCKTFNVMDKIKHDGECDYNSLLIKMKIIDKRIRTNKKNFEEDKKRRIKLAKIQAWKRLFEFRINIIHNSTIHGLVIQNSGDNSTNIQNIRNIRKIDIPSIRGSEKGE
jgi:hypothetical protein